MPEKIIVDTSSLIALEKIELLEGYQLSSLAPWSYLKDKWFIEGNFSLPPLKDTKLYERAEKDGAKAREAQVIH